MFNIVTGSLLALDGNSDLARCLSHVGTEGTQDRDSEHRDDLNRERRRPPYRYRDPGEQALEVSGAAIELNDEP
jgi:hypothetical protein